MAFDNPLLYRFSRARFAWIDCLRYALIVLLPAALCRGDVYASMLVAGSLHYLYFSAFSYWDSVGLVARDRDSRALETLLTSPASRVGIVAAYLWRALLVRRGALLLTPVTGYFFRDYLHLAGFAQILVLTVLITLCYAGLGLGLALRLRSTFSALLAGVALWASQYFVSAYFQAIPVNPILSSVGLLDHAGEDSFWPCLALHLPLAAALFAFACWALRGYPRPQMAGFRRRLRPFGHPLLYRELRFPLPLVEAVLPLAYGMNGVKALVALSALKATAQAVASVRDEKRRQTWDALLGSRLSVPEIVAGKAFCVLVPLWSGLLVGRIFYPTLEWLGLSFAGVWAGTGLGLLAASLSSRERFVGGASLAGLAYWGGLPETLELWVLGLVFLLLAQWRLGRGGFR